MLELILRGTLILGAAVYWVASATTLLRMAQAVPVTPMDGFHRSIARWGYVQEGRRA
mgnify:CR=1 FL=1